MAIKVAATSNIWVTRFFKLSTQLLFSKMTDTPDEICQLMNGTKVSDVRGDTCEYLSSRLKQTRCNVQFRTSRPIILMMVELVDRNSMICFFSFLVYASEYLKNTISEKNSSMLKGGVVHETLSIRPPVAMLPVRHGVNRSPHAGHEAPFINESHIRIPFQENARESPCGKGI